MNGVADGRRERPGAARRRIRAAGGSPLLAAALDCGLLTTGDAYIARRIATLSGASIADEVVLATALAARAVRNGSTCVELDRLPEIAAEYDGLALPKPDDLFIALRRSELVAGCPSGPLRPLALAVSGRSRLLYLRKYFRHEQNVRRILDERARSRPAEVGIEALTSALDGAFGTAVNRVGDGPYDRQRVAAALAVTSWTTVLAGGPGTGKTYTVARLLAVLEDLLGGDIRIGLCAPTGRAAAALQSAISDYGGLTGVPTAVTVHRLVGARPDGTFRHGTANRVPYDVVVVDETSMLPVAMMARLLESLRPDTRLILVGDPHQLVSVEAGSVLADLVDRAGAASDDVPEPSTAVVAATGLSSGDLTEPELHAVRRGVITLRHGYRYGSEIGALADAVNAGATDTVLRLVGAASPEIRFTPWNDLDVIRDEVIGWADEMIAAAVAGDERAALRALSRHRVLCAHRDGPYGVGGWSAQIQQWLAEARVADRHGHADTRYGRGDSGGEFGDGGWYAGQPLLVTASDRAAEVYNGDCGVVVAVAGELLVGFPRGQRIQRVHPSRLDGAVPAYAMTIHRSQGSQFDTVTVVLPPDGSELLTRELLYTAITRARRAVHIVGDPEWLRAAVDRRVARASGLRAELREVDGDVPAAAGSAGRGTGTA